VKNELKGDVEIRELTNEEFRPVWNQYAPLVFDNAFRLHLEELLSDDELEQTKRLKSNLGHPVVLRFGVFKGEEFVGWHVGNQITEYEYYMRNSAILPAYRKQGLYSALVEYVVRRGTDLGFQQITSRHTATNNAVIIAKLKLGFVITGLEISDIFGTLVHLTYFTNPDRRRVMGMRSGESRPDDEIKKWLNL